MEEIKKPITLAQQDFTKDLVELVNSSGLPAFVISNILRDVKLSVDKIAEEQLQRDADQYYTELQKNDSKQKGGKPKKYKGGVING